MTLKLMICYQDIHDIGVEKDKDGNQRPMGSICGRGVSVPIVSCPIPGMGDRLPIQACAECINMAGCDAHFIFCNYKEMPKNEHVEVKIIPEDYKEVQLKRKIPDNVFVPPGQ